MKRNSKWKPKVRELESDPEHQEKVARVFSIMRDISRENRESREKQHSTMTAKGFSERREYQTSGGFSR